MFFFIKLTFSILVESHKGHKKRNRSLKGRIIREAKGRLNLHLPETKEKI